MSTIPTISRVTAPSLSVTSSAAVSRKKATPAPSAPSEPASTAAPPSSSASTSSSQTIATLQQQMMLYTQFADGSGSATADYKALQDAILTKNVSDAQTAMAALQRDSDTANLPSPAATSSNPAADNLSNLNGSSGVTKP